MEFCYKVDINFDEASSAWNQNKKRVGQSYVYICGCLTKKGSKCLNKRYRDLDYCYIHRNFKK